MINLNLNEENNKKKFINDISDSKNLTLSE